VKRVLVTIQTWPVDDSFCGERCPLLSWDLDSDDGDKLSRIDAYCNLGDGVDACVPLDKGELDCLPKRSEFCKREAK
jgi:hypothetical protein